MNRYTNFARVKELVNVSLMREGVSAAQWSRLNGLKAWRLSRLLNGRLPWREHTDSGMRQALRGLLGRHCSAADAKWADGVLSDSRNYLENYEHLIK